MLVGIPSLWPLLAFPHDTNNSSTPCDKSPGHNHPEFTVAHQWKKITTESTESQSWEQPLVASFCAWVHGGPQRCVALCNSAAKWRQELHYSLLFPRPVDVSVGLWSFGGWINTLYSLNSALVCCCYCCCCCFKYIYISVLVSIYLSGKRKDDWVKDEYRHLIKNDVIWIFKIANHWFPPPLCKGQWALCK